MSDEQVTPLVNYNDWNINLAGSPGQQGSTGPASMPEAPNDGFTYARQSLAWTSAPHWSGNVTVSGGAVTVGSNAYAGNPALNLACAAGAYQCSIMSYKGGQPRWQIYMPNNGAETGSNAGSDFFIQRYGDAGAGIDTPFYIVRQTGTVHVGTASVAYPQLYIHAASNANAFIQTSNSVGSWLFGSATDGTFYVMSSTLEWQLQAGSKWSATRVGYQGSLGITYPGVGTGNYFGFSWGSPYIYGVVDGSTSYGFANASDERLKADIAPSSHDCLAMIDAIDLYEFRWKDHSTPGQPVYDPDAPLVPAGFVAQRLYEQAPHLVMKGDDHGEMSDRRWIGDDGLPIHKESERRFNDRGEEIGSVVDPDDMRTMWNIEPNNMMATLVGAVQQLSKRVVELEAALAAR
jgi:hypothetical protein